MLKKEESRGEFLLKGACYLGEIYGVASVAIGAVGKSWVPFVTGASLILLARMKDSFDKKGQERFGKLNSGLESQVIRAVNR